MPLSARPAIKAISPPMLWPALLRRFRRLGAHAALLLHAGAARRRRHAELLLSPVIIRHADADCVSQHDVGSVSGCRLARLRKYYEYAADKYAGLCRRHGHRPALLPISISTAARLFHAGRSHTASPHVAHHARAKPPPLPPAPTHGPPLTAA